MTAFKAVIITTLLFFSSPLYGAIDITNITGASHFDLSPPIPVIYAVLENGRLDCNRNSVSRHNYCNTCAQPGNKNCSPHTLHRDSTLTIKFIEPHYTGRARVTNEDGDEIPYINSLPDRVGGSEHTISFLWEDVCAILSESNCMGVHLFSKNILVGVSDYPGSFETWKMVKVVFINPNLYSWQPQLAQTDFAAIAGRAKAYIHELVVWNYFPSLMAGISAAKLRVYYSENNFESTFALNSNRYQDFELDLDSDHILPMNMAVDGLTTGILYYFKMAVVDEAGIVTELTSVEDYTSNEFCNSNVQLPPRMERSCPYTARIY